MLLLKKAGFQLESGAKIVKADDYAAVVKAESIIAEAQAEADRLVSAAQDVYNGEKKRGYEDGIAEGRMAMSEQLMDMTAKSINFFGGLEEEVVELVIQAIKRILGSIDSSDLIVKVVRNALAVARNQHEVKIRVAPSQVAVLNQRLNELLADYPGINYLMVVEDQRLPNNGCILETDLGLVEASIDVQIESMRKALMKSFRRTP